MQGVLGLIDLQPAQDIWELDASKESSLRLKTGARSADGKDTIVLTYCAGHGAGAVPVVKALAWVLPEHIMPSVLHGLSSLSE